MKVVVDTNIVFSALMNADNSMGDILLNFQNDLDFFAPDLLNAELNRYSDKLIGASKLSEEQLAESRTRISEVITTISEDLISTTSWKAAYALTKGIDENDTPFVALAIELNAFLWTGDRKLAQGLQKIKENLIISTSELTKMLEHG